MKHSLVYHTLSGSNARLLGERRLTDDLHLAFWQNHNDRVHYTKDKQHTLSLYLNGGHGSRRVDGRYRTSGRTGAAGTLCLLPQGEESTWEISETHRFAHLYFPDRAIKRFAERERNMDPQRVQLPDLTFAQHESLEALTRHLFLTAANDNPLQVEQKLLPIYDCLISIALDQPVTQPWRGGLSTVHQRRLKEYLAEHFEQTLTLSDLAGLVDLSEYHLQRAFKTSLGCSPAEYQRELRLDHARHLLSSGEQANSVAIACGFANPAHFSRIFKQHLGVTPSEYRTLA
ncbi:helix-turn-helix domain-containing protein [Reinekea blandensis]|nr:helix-turn-helix domain-containing protein [Reinekea blandensis]